MEQKKIKIKCNKEWEKGVDSGEHWRKSREIPKVTSMWIKEGMKEIHILVNNKPNGERATDNISILLIKMRRGRRREKKTELRSTPQITARDNE